MPRAYTIATAALVLGVSAKWLDNALSHFKVPGVAQKRQGVARRLTVESLLHLSIAVILGRVLNVPLGHALEVARQVVSGDGRLATNELQLEFSLSTLHAEILNRLDNAVEITPMPRRGRRPKTTTGRLE